jgi:hypothetical protein
MWMYPIAVKIAATQPYNSGEGLTWLDGEAGNREVGSIKKGENL